MNFAFSKDVFVCASAGNNGTTQKSYPAAYVGVMAVASSDPDDSRSSFSQYGNWVQIAAPGSQIMSTVMGGGYEAWDGTSMACPVVTGVAGLVWSRGFGSISHDEVFQAIVDTADFAPGGYVTGGRINAFAAAQAAVVTATATFEPVSVIEFIGTNISGGLSDLAAADGSLYNLLTSVQGRQGTLGGAEVVFQLDRPLNELFKFKMNFRTRASRTSTGMVWFLNQNTQEWDFIKAFPAKTSLTSTQLKVQAIMSDYVDAGGQITVRIRGHIASGRPGGSAPFTFGIDLATMQADYEVVEP
jgi:thermitase